MHDVIYLSINKSWSNQLKENLYEATNFAWRIAKNKAEKNSIKYAFDGVIAFEIRDRFIGKSVDLIGQQVGQSDD